MAKKQMIYLPNGKAMNIDKIHKKYRKVLYVFYNIIFFMNIALSIFCAFKKDWTMCFAFANAAIISSFLLDEYDESERWQNLCEEMLKKEEKQ